MTVQTFGSFSVGQVLDSSEVLITVTAATAQGDDFILRLRVHENQDLYTGHQTANQLVPASTFDTASLAVLDQFVIDSASFVKRPNGQLAKSSEGGNSYTLRVTSGRVRIDALEQRQNPKTKESITAPGAFGHGQLTVSRMGAIPKESGFDASLDAPAPEAAPRRRVAV